ncbi:MAG: hypothetical protein IKG27_04925 [Bacilli bacterium]|nr:hypothetical protein [Bacilli bacterium]
MLKRKIRVHKLSKVKKYIIVVFICMMSLTLTVSFGKYVYKRVLNLYFLTQNFFFESDKLKDPAASYSLNYWNGVDPYDIAININSFKNDKLKSSHDITYTTRYSCPNNVICSLSKTSGTVSANSNTDNFTFTMTPNAIFNDNDSVTFSVYASSTSPYVKELSATFTLIVGKYGLGHSIEDSAGDPYLTLRVTNTLDSYLVKESFSDTVSGNTVTYTEGNHISKAIYDVLTDINKRKCASAIITVAFDPTVVLIDNTSSDFIKAYDIETQSIGGYNYVKKFKFDMDSSISSVIKFYKKNKNADYSNSNVLTVTYRY